MSSFVDCTFAGSNSVCLRCGEVDEGMTCMCWHVPRWKRAMSEIEHGEAVDWRLLAIRLSKLIISHYGRESNRAAYDVLRLAEWKE